MEQTCLEVDGEGHTLACLLDDRMLRTASFAAAVVLHPQDAHLTIKMVSKAPRAVVGAAVRDVSRDVDALIRALASSD